MRDWWRADPRPETRTPNWDIASTCLIDGQRGLLLVEAKAHRGELSNGGKRFNKKSNKENHERIGRAIAEANECLRSATKLDWNPSSTYCYQMSNRFAWAWKLCSLGYSVALVYLGFIDANEMTLPFYDEDEWVKFVKEHSARLFPAEIWGRNIRINGASLMPIIRHSCLRLNGEDASTRQSSKTAM